MKKSGDKKEERMRNTLHYKHKADFWKREEDTNLQPFPSPFPPLLLPSITSPLLRWFCLYYSLLSVKLCGGKH